MTSKLFTASLLASALFAGLATAPALAQTNTPRVDQAQQNISARIRQGMESGHITPSEAQTLLRRERAIEVREAQFKSNGQASPQERQALRNELNDLGAEVERLMANQDVVRRGNTNTPAIDNQFAAVSQRIDEGVRNGRINRREERQLRKQESNFMRREAAFRADGRVTQQERRQMRDELASLRNQVERAFRYDARNRG